MIASIMQIDAKIAESCKRTGFPDTQEKTDNFIRILGSEPLLIVCDDFHCLHDDTVLRFMERFITGLTPNLKIFLLCYEMPMIDISRLQAADLISKITEQDLNFNEVELANCLRQQNVSADSDTVREILKDTGGWAFAVNLAVRSLRRIPRYAGFVQSRLKPNIFEFFESENWTSLSDNLKHFLIRLSFVDCHYAGLVDVLTGNQKNKDSLLSELKQQNAYIKFDNDEGIYFIHHLYLDFLREKQALLESDEKNKILKIEIDWRDKLSKA
jgi:LuxR family maltose regulon positive regulatory protein